MQEENITEQEGLAIIEAMINKAKNRFSENGFLYLLWGWVIFVCSVAQFVLLNVFHYERHYLVWMLTWIAVIIQIIYLYRRKRRKTVKTYTDDIIGYVWITFVILMFLMIFLMGRTLDEQHFMFIDVIFLALYGMPTFLSGIILKFRALIIGGICCWVLSAAATAVQPEYQLLFLAAGVIAAWIIPGYLLRMRYRQENVSN